MSIPQLRKGRQLDIPVALITTVTVIGLILLLGIPVAKLIGIGVSERGLAAITQSFGANVDTLVNTLVLGLCVGIVGTFIGFVTAFAQVFLTFPGKKLLHWVTLLPTISPPFATATAIITLFGKRGIITYGIFGIENNIYGLVGLVMVLSLTFAPVAYLNIRGMMENFDNSLFEASATLGAQPLSTLVKVTIPMVVPAMLASFLVLFVEGIADLANPLVLGGDFRVLASQIYFAVAGSGDIASAAGIALVLLLPALTVFAVQKYWSNRKSVITVTGKPVGSLKEITASSVKIPMLVPVYGWIVFVIVVYMTLFVGSFVKILGVDNTFTMEHFWYVQRLGSSAILTTLSMTLVAAPIAAVMALIIAWLVVRKFPKIGKILDFWGMLGIAIPGTVLGLGFALAYSNPTWLFGKQILPTLAGGLAVGGGAIAIILVYIARAIPTGQQACISALKQINPQVEEAARSLGASQVSTLVKVTLPLVRSGIVTAVTYGITKSMTMITAIIFITTPQTKVMTSQILDEVDAGRFGHAFAYCTFLIGLVLIILMIANLLVNRLNRSTRTVVK